METDTADGKIIEELESLDTGSGVSTPSDGADSELDEQRHEIRSIFGNDLIFDVIGDYLEIPDLKIMRQTCKLLLKKVNKHRKFVPNLTITVTDETIREAIKSPQQALGWRSVKIFIEHLAPENFAKIPSLALRHLQLIQSVKEDYIPPKPAELVVHRTACYDWLRSSNLNLVSLTLDLDLLTYSIPTNALDNIVGTLQELRFVGEIMTFFGEESSPVRRLTVFQENMKMIGNLQWKLRSIYSHRRIEFHQTQGSAAMKNILSSSANTIEKIQVEYFEDTAVFAGTDFPGLKELDLGVSQVTPEKLRVVGDFLNSLPKLESLKLRFAARVTPEILEAVRRISGPKLHTLVYEAVDLLRTTPDADSWRFIQDLKGLKSFELYVSGLEDYRRSRILDNLPGTLESLEMKDLTWIYSTPAERAALASHLTGFHHLTSLKINSPHFQDDMLQSICSTLIRLRTFRFPLFHITDFGLTGKRGVAFDSGISLRNLRGLREIVVHAERTDVTPQGLVEAIQFKELRVMCVNPIFIQDDVLCIIASYNPSLEEVTRFVPGRKEDFDDRILFSRLLRVNPRLTRVKTVFREGRGSEYSGGEEYDTRPSYGVSSTAMDEPTIERVRNTMKIANFPGNSLFPYSTYHYDL